MVTVTDFLSTQSFRIPEWRPTSAWIEHGPFAFWLIEQLRPRLVVELGTHFGYSFAAFCEAMHSLDIDGRVVAVDTWAGDEHAGYYGEAVFNRLRDHIESRYSALAEMKKMLFSQALLEVEDGSVELLHVDGRHYYEDVVEDYTSWLPKLADGAVVLFHDTQVRDRGFGVYRYWSELAAAHPNFEFHHGHGLGIMSCGSTKSNKLDMLLASDLPPEVRADVRFVYARLGGGISSLQAVEHSVARAPSKARSKDPLSRLAASFRKRVGITSALK